MPSLLIDAPPPFDPDWSLIDWATSGGTNDAPKAVVDYWLSGRALWCPENYPYRGAKGSKALEPKVDCPDVLAAYPGHPIPNVADQDRAIAQLVEFHNEELKRYGLVPGGEDLGPKGWLYGGEKWTLDPQHSISWAFEGYCLTQDERFKELLHVAADWVCDQPGYASVPRDLLSSPWDTKLRACGGLRVLAESYAVEPREHVLTAAANAVESVTCHREELALLYKNTGMTPIPWAAKPPKPVAKHVPGRFLPGIGERLGVEITTTSWATALNTIPAVRDSQDYIRKHCRGVNPWQLAVGLKSALMMGRATWRHHQHDMNPGAQDLHDACGGLANDLAAAIVDHSTRPALDYRTGEWVQGAKGPHEWISPLGGIDDDGNIVPVCRPETSLTPWIIGPMGDYLTTFGSALRTGRRKQVETFLQAIYPKNQKASHWSRFKYSAERHQA